MSSIFRKKYRHKFNHSQILQLQKIKFDLDSDTSDTSEDKVSSTRCVYNDISTVFETTELFKRYAIIKKFYEKQDKATYLIQEITTQVKYILKIRHDNCANSFETEIYRLLKDEYHKNVINFVYYDTKYNYQYFIYEYFEGVNLLEYLKSKKRLEENEIKNILIQIANAVIFLHSHNIIHCDLKLDNVIINDKNELKVIDFDLSIICDNEDGYIFNNIFGTMEYIAPESYDLCIYSKKSDVWQLGIILYILITNQFPFCNSIELVNSKSNLCRQNIFKHIDLTVPKTIINEYRYNELLYDLLCKTLSFDDSKRITVNEIKNYLTLINKKI